MSEYSISVIPPNMVEFLWPEIAPLIKLPIDLSHDEVTLAIAKKELMSGNISVVAITHGIQMVAVSTLEVRTFPTGKRCLYIPLTGGTDLDEWMDDFLNLAKDMAKAHNCTHIRGLAVRRGWLRKLEQFGFEPISTTIEMEIKT